MTNEKNKFQNVELEKSMSVLESILNNHSIEEIEKTMSQYRVLAFSKKDYNKEIMEKTVKAYQKYIKQKTIDNNREIAESISIKPDRHFFGRSLEGTMSLIFGTATGVISIVGYKVFEMFYEDLMKGDYKLAVLKAAGIGALGFSAIATSLFSFANGYNAIKGTGAYGNML